jgi:hypothetical protein
MAKRKQVSFPTSRGRVSFLTSKKGEIKTVIPKAEREKIDASITKKYCPFFKEKCKGLNCAFGDTKGENFIWGGISTKKLYCKLFEGLTGNLKFNIETSIKEED